VLDIGTGCGIIAIIAAKKAKRVIATDVNPHAIKCAKHNAEANEVVSKVDMRQGDLFQPLRKNERFNLIVFNAPYLPSFPLEQNTWIGRSWAGGSSGRHIIDRFIEKAPRYLKRNGRILLVQSSLANIDETLKEFREAGLRSQVVAEKKVAFETIVVVQAKTLI